MERSGANDDSCDGSCCTFAEIESRAVANLAAHGEHETLLHMERVEDLAFARLLARGVFVPCPVHPGSYQLGADVAG